MCSGCLDFPYSKIEFKILGTRSHTPFDYFFFL